MPFPHTIENIGGLEQGDILRGYLEENLPFQSVKSIGAKGDGSTDDTAVIQTAVNVVALAGGGTVFFPPGTYRYSQISLKSGVRLVGSGVYATTLKQISSTNAPGIVLSTSTTDLVGCANLLIDGNKAGQVGSVSHGIQINNANPQGSYKIFDPFFSLTDVVVQNCDGAGIYLTGARGSALLTRVGAILNNLQGFYLDSADHTLTSCWAGSNYYAGFHQTAVASSCVIGGCRAFTNGANPSLQASDVGAGFYATNATNSVFSSCTSNGNGGHGFQFDNVRQFTLAACNAGGNGVNANYSSTGTGFYLKTPGQVSIQGESYNYPGQTHQSYGLFLESPNGSNTRYEIVFGLNANANNVAPIGGTNGVHATINQTIRQSASQLVAYAASITPDPTLGEIVNVDALTGGITVNNPTVAWTGARLTFLFTQDGTGGRVVTWGSQFKTNWTPDTTLNKRNTISFVCDGTGGTTRWVQTASATGL